MGLAQTGRQDLTSNVLSGMNKLLVGRVDLIVGNPHSIPSLCASAGVPENIVKRTILLSGTADYYVAASLDMPAATVERLREQYRQLRGTGYLHQLAARYHVALRQAAYCTSSSCSSPGASGNSLTTVEVRVP